MWKLAALETTADQTDGSKLVDLVTLDFSLKLLATSQLPVANTARVLLTTTTKTTKRTKPVPCA